MKPHRLSDLLSDLCRRINPAYGPGRQKGEFVEALANAGIRPEHGNRGEELETLVLVDAVVLKALRSELAALNKILASVPYLVKSAFQEGFRVDGGALGGAWENSQARKVLDGEATPRPPSWDADKHRIAVLDAQLRVRIPDGVACGHQGCLHHVSHPCEGCGRIAGRSSPSAGAAVVPEASHPWGVFLDARAAVLDWLHGKGNADAEIASTLCMDATQVHSIRNRNRACDVRYINHVHPSRLLKEGEREELELLRSLRDEVVLYEWAADPRGDGDPSPHRRAVGEIIRRLDDLRSNGGATTGKEDIHA